MNEPPAELAEAAEACLIAWTVGDIPAASANFDVICDHGPQGMYAAALAWAMAAVKLLGMDRQGGFWGLEIEGVDDLDTLPEDQRDGVWAGRFITATGNGDFDTCMALLKAELDGGSGERMAKRVIAVLDIAAAAMRERPVTGG